MCGLYKLKFRIMYICRCKMSNNTIILAIIISICIFVNTYWTCEDLELCLNVNLAMLEDVNEVVLLALEMLVNK